MEPRNHQTKIEQKISSEESLTKMKYNRPQTIKRK